MRVARTRTRTLAVSGPGSICWGPPGPGCYAVSTVITGKESCSDSHGSPLVDSAFTLKRGVFPRVHVSGTRHDFTWTYTIIDRPLVQGPLNVAMWPCDYAGASGPAIISDNTLALMALSNINPNNPLVDLPVEILELRDLPELLRDAGRIALGRPNRVVKNVAKANVMAQFGVAPIISDIMELCNFAEAVSKREQQLRKMRDVGRRFRRNLTKQSWEYDTGNWTAFDPKVDTSGYSKFNLKVSGTRQYWYSIHANLSVAPSEREIQSLAFRSLLGLDSIHASSLWELLPWSWLIDYFTTTGTLLGAYRSGIPWTWSRLNVMYRDDYVTRGSFPFLQNNLHVDLPNPQGYAVRKVRRPISLVWTLPAFKVPYLTGSQWSILASLAALRL